MAKKVSVDNFATEIVQAVKEYTDDVAAAIEKEVHRTAELVKKDAQASAPVQTGKYKKGISRKKDTKTRGAINHIIYNRSRPSIAHLLEFGHAKRGGGRVAARPHLRPAYDKHVPQMEKNIENIIRNGG